MKIKTKLIVSIGLLFAIILFMGTFTVIRISQIEQETENIFADNYNSVGYGQKMQRALITNDLKKLRENLLLQKKNVTRRYEASVTDDLERQLEAYEKDPTVDNYRRLSLSINTISLLNLSEIYRRGEHAGKNAGNLMVLIAVLSLISAVVALIMLLFFPKMITRPINQLTEGILDVSRENYDKRLNFSSSSEYGLVAESFNNMTAQLAELRRQNLSNLDGITRYLETIINSIGDPVIGLDERGTVIFANEATQTILGIEHEELLGKSALVLSLYHDIFNKIMVRRGVQGDVPLEIPVGSKICYYLVKCVLNPNNNGTVIILYNITKFKELDHAKTNFIATVSHELKTPIAAVMMNLDLLDGSHVGEMNDDQRELCGNIRENNERLLAITGELLKMTQVEAGKLSLTPRTVSPIEFINDAVNATKALAEKKNCRIEIEYSKELPKLFVDSEKIAWVITNLVINALNHSSVGSYIIIGAQEVDCGVEIYVQDFGVGIDPQYHKKIFERYFRVPGTKVQGSGLGLAISKDFLEAHGGTIRVESSLQNGSRFIATLISGSEK